MMRYRDDTRFDWYTAGLVVLTLVLLAFALFEGLAE